VAAGGGGDLDGGSSRRLEQGGRPGLEAAGVAARPAGAVEVVAVVVVTDQHGVDWAEVGGGDRRPVSFRELEPQPKLYRRPGGVEGRIGQ
jgi:hypothetical protein